MLSGGYYGLRMSALSLPPLCKDVLITPLEARILLVDFSNLQDILITIKSCLEIFLASFWKQDGRHRSFFSVMKSAYISLIIDPRGMACEANL